ncbi:MAG: hypothetical protein ACT4QD_15135 [Acidobacteriota bacterium]
MKLVHPVLILVPLALLGAVTLVAQAPPPAAAKMARTWTDEDLDRLMKEIGSTVGTLRKSVDGQNAEMAKQQAGRMEALFEEVDDFWNARNVRDAADWADDAAEHADHVEDAVDEKDFAKAGEHLKLLQSMCATCHTKYRDNAPDGGFRIKP